MTNPYNINGKRAMQNQPIIYYDQNGQVITTDQYSIYLPQFQTSHQQLQVP